MRLIDTDALGVGRCSKDILPAAYCAGWNGLINILEKADTVDAVVVTRCKDCKYMAGALPNDKGFLICPASGMEIIPDDFCSYGEPREVTNADDHD